MSRLLTLALLNSSTFVLLLIVSGCSSNQSAVPTVPEVKVANEIVDSDIEGNKEGQNQPSFDFASINSKSDILNLLSNQQSSSIIRLFYEGNPAELDLIDGGIALAIALLRQGGVTNPSFTDIQNQANSALLGTGLVVENSDISGTPDNDPVSASDFDGDGDSATLSDAAILLGKILLLQGGNTNPSTVEIEAQANALLSGTGITATIASGQTLPGPGATPFPTPTSPSGLPQVVVGSSSVRGALTLDDSVLPNAAGDRHFIDFFEISGAEIGDFITISVDSAIFDAFVYILFTNSSTGDLLDFTSDDDSGGGSNPEYALVVEPGLDYVIGVSSFFPLETGEYSVSVVGTQSEPTILSVPGTLTTQLSSDDERLANGEFADGFVLEGVVPGETISITMTSSDIDTFLTLGDGTQTLQDNDDLEPGQTTNSQIRFVAQPGVNYVVGATSFAPNELGTYTLAADRSGTDTVPTPTPSPGGQPLRPDDPRYNDQYGYENVGMPEVWGTNTSTNSVRVAVIDDGIMAGGHPDLPERSVSNARIITFPDGRRNDAIGASAADTPFNFTEQPSASNNPVHHGTHVAGTIAAIPNNAEGVTGVVWGGNVDIPLDLVSINTFQFNEGSKSFTTGFFDLAEAIRYASGIPSRLGPGLSPPADVINLSIQAEVDCPQTLEDAFADAARQGVITVVAAGNAASGRPFSPASCPSVTLSVGATDEFNQLARFSNFNFNDISAPGVSILSTLRPDNLYERYDGTSMASPHVAGAAAMLLAQNTNLSPNDVRTLLVNSAANFGDPRMGAGILRLPNAFLNNQPGIARGVSAKAIEHNILPSQAGAVAARGQIESRTPFVSGQIVARFTNPERVTEHLRESLGSDVTALLPTPNSQDSPVLIQLNINGLSLDEAKQKTVESIQQLLQLNDVVYAEPNYIAHPPTVSHASLP